jgi:signal transduction histidine kinase
MLPTSHPAPIHQPAEVNLSERAALADAFVDFSTAATKLESSYSELRKEVTRLRATLAQRTQALNTSLVENAQVKLTLRQVVDSLPCGVLVLNAERKVELINPEARRLMEIGGAELSDLTDFPEICRSASSALPKSSTDLVENEFLLRGATESRWLAIRTRQLPDPQNDKLEVGLSSRSEGLRTVLILRDTTDQKRLEGEREAARNVVALAEMATVLAHEIRNPLASLELFAGLIARNDSGTEQYVSQLRAGIRSLSSTVNNILMFHDGCQIQPVRVSLGESLRSAVDFLRPLAEQKKIHLSLDERAEELAIMGDESGLRQVFLNLALNAFRHTAEGGSLQVVSRRRERHGSASALVEFRDNGSGISAETMPHIFEAGFSANGQTPGLGLTVCRRIIDQCGGILSARSELGRGSIFSIEIPTE